MKKLIVVPALILLWAAQSPALEKMPLRLIQTISLNGLTRHWDHFGVDVKSNRLFVTSSDEPAVYDPDTKYLYVVNGGRAAKTPYCLISVVDMATDKKLADIKLDTNRLESMALEKTGTRRFVNMTTANVIGVVDREKRALVATWPITAGQQNVPMRYDESTHRLFVATRMPSRLVVVNTDTGKEVTSLPTADSVDDLAYDATLHRLYVPGGNLNGAVGAITVTQQKDADHYELIANIPTKPGARNARLVSELKKYYVNVSTKGPQDAQILVYDVVP